MQRSSCAFVVVRGGGGFDGVCRNLSAAGLPNSLRCLLPGTRPCQAGSPPDGKRSTILSHHFDTPTAREDPRLNLCDMYLFAGSPVTTVMAMTVNPAATAEPSAPPRGHLRIPVRYRRRPKRRRVVQVALH